MAQPRVYLDYNATAPLRASARAAMIDALDAANPSSVHAEGRAAKGIVETARRQVAALAEVGPAQIVFTSGATESNAQAIVGWNGPIAVSATEHDAVRANAVNAVELPVNADGLLELDALADLPRGTLVCVMSGQNETGVLADMATLGERCARLGLAWHCDAVQSVGRGVPSPMAFGARSMTVSSHKIGGPKGAGALVLRDPADAAPLIGGGGQEKGLRAGTENVAALAGFGAAAEEAARDDWAELSGLRDWIEERIVTISPEAKVVGARAPRLPNTSCIALPGADAQGLVIAFDLAGFAISAGSACSSGKVRRSHVLRAMGLDDRAASGAVRISLGPQISRTEAEEFIDAWSTIARKSLAA